MIWWNADAWLMPACFTHFTCVLQLIYALHNISLCVDFVIPVVGLINIL